MGFDSLRKSIDMFLNSEERKYYRIAQTIMEQVPTSDEDKYEVSIIGRLEGLHYLNGSEEFINRINKYMECYHVTKIECNSADEKHLLVEVERNGYKPSNVIEWTIKK